MPGKNLADFCGKPLIAWTIEQALAAHGLASVWVSSDDEEILSVAESYGATPISRPGELATDTATSEAAWCHALDMIEQLTQPVDLVCAVQATSPLREPVDLERALDDFSRQGCDSLFSASPLEDFLIWERGRSGSLRPINYDPAARARRQERAVQYVENGSFYIFRPDMLRATRNRMGGRIGMSIMEFWEAFEVDYEQGLEMCAALMRRFLAP
jgi:CMP-N,N'-diacetyllegionaminic acid synthase